MIECFLKVFLCITSVSAFRLVGAFVLIRQLPDSGFGWWRWRDPAAAGFRRTRETLCTRSDLRVSFKKEKF